MTLRKVWDPKPLAERYCVGCGQPIYRNLARFDGEPWHYGELYRSGKLVEARHYCFDCYSFLTSRMLVYTTSPDGRCWRTCGVCGSGNVRWLGRSDQVEVFYP